MKYSAWSARSPMSPLRSVLPLILVCGSVFAADPAAPHSAARRGYELLVDKAYLPPDFDQETFDAVWKQWPEPLRSAALAGRAPAKSDPELTADDENGLSAPGPKRQAVLNRLLFAGPTKEFEQHRETYGDTSQSAILIVSGRRGPGCQDS